MAKVATGQSRKMVSVVVPVFNDSERLSACLDALSRQTLGRELFEVIVVDNGSTEDIRVVCDRFDGVRYAVESRRSSYAARNTGIERSCGAILAFTDSDCIPAEDWLAKGRSYITSDETCGLIGGEVELFFRNPKNPTAVELYETLTAFPQENNVREQNFSVTANMFTTRAVLDAVGCFDVRLQSGGDWEWGNRVARAGYRLTYCPDLQVAHPARHSPWELARKVVRVRRGVYTLTSANDYSWRRYLKDLAPLLRPALRAGLEVWRNEALGSKRKRAGIALVFTAVRYLHAFQHLRIRCQELFGTRRKP